MHFIISKLRALFSDKQLLKQLVAFGFIGVTATAIHYFVALYLVEAQQVEVLFANVAGYSCAVAVSYFGHGKITFNAQLDKKMFVRFATTSLSALIASELLLVFLHSYLGLVERYALIAVVCSIPVLTFLISKFWVFKQ